MNIDRFIRDLLPGTVCMTPAGFSADELTPEDFARVYRKFFQNVFEISKTDISGISGFGYFNEDCRTQYSTCRDYLTDTFAQKEVGYWCRWYEMFETTILDRDVFFKFYDKMVQRIEYCEGKRFLVNGSTWFSYIMTDGKRITGFPDWSRARICDFLLDFVIMDGHKPYLQIPERLAQYLKEEGMQVPDFKERYLCMSYYSGLEGLRWHASIDDPESYYSILKYLEELEDRIMSIEMRG